jgi:MT0933-like antitoxin protein
MGFSDWFKKGKNTAAENKDAVKEGIDKGADMADEKTDGKYTEQIDQGAEKAKDMVDGLGDE